jgi:hypothetical protein
MGRGSSGPATNWSAWRRPLAHVAIVVAFVFSVLGYPLIKKSGAEPQRPQQAAQPINSHVAASHIASARVNVLAGDTRSADAHVNALAHDLARTERIPAATRPIDHEAGRAAVRPLPGVRSAIWLDAANFVVMVDGAQNRSMDMIDRVCLALESLGDTLAVVVNLQDVGAANPDAVMTLSRNCQLPDGQRALLQANRQVDVVAPALRRTFKAQQ